MSSLTALPIVKAPYDQLCHYYSDAKSHYPLVNQLLGTVESSVAKTSTVVGPYLAKYQPQIEKFDNMANERVVKKLIDYCGPVVQKTPTEISEETKMRVHGAVENVRQRAVHTRDQIYNAPTAGREMLTEKYNHAIEIAGDKARHLKSDVPKMLPESARQYAESVWNNYGLDKRYEQLTQAASATTERVLDTYRNMHFSPAAFTSDLVTPFRSRLEHYWNETSPNFESTQRLVYDSYNWLKSTRLAAIASARDMIDNTVGAVWEYTSDFSKEFSETYATGSRSELLQMAGRRLRSAKDVTVQLSRWTYGELISLQEASTSVLDVILASWVFHWLSFRPIQDQQQQQPTEAEQSAGVSTGTDNHRVEATEDDESESEEDSEEDDDDDDDDEE